MNRYGLPMAFAAALHSIVLFGFNCRPSKATVAKPSPTCGGCSLPQSLDEVELAVPFAEPAPLASAGFKMPPFALPDLTCWQSCPFPGAVLAIPPPELAVAVTPAPILGAILPIEPFTSGGIIPSTLLDCVPTARHQVAPSFPLGTRRGRASDEVVVEFVVNERGDVVKASVTSSTDSELEAPTLQAIMKWKFDPGLRHGRVVPFRMVVPVVFRPGD